MRSAWAFAANTRRHVHNLCVHRVLVRSASVQRGYVRGVPAINEIHRSREERRRGWKEREREAGRVGRCDVVCAARVRRVLGQYELCTARECKVHAEQTSRPNAFEWTELRLSFSSSSSFHLRRCRLMHVCTRYSKILVPGYKVLGTAPASAANARTS
jgi:hypothetical protein